MTLLASLMAFIETPVGSALLAEVPTLIQDVIGIWHKNGVLTTQMVADYLATAPTFDQLSPKKAP